jgi:UDP-3-O-[3-hydroxymyristoyl] glucosamine N-acyltransferase
MMINIIGFSQASITNDVVNLFAEQNINSQIISPDDFFANQFNRDNRCIITVTKDLDLRCEIGKKLDQDHLERATVIHQSCYIDRTAKIEAGTVIGPFSVVAYTAVVGKDCLIGPYSMISHQSTLGDNCIIQSGTMIAGGTTVGSRCTFGFRSSTLDKLEICSGSVIGAGSFVTKNIMAPGRYVGSPARRISSTA